ncbi:MAG: hypothetical protein IJ645_02185, partial [Ruminococcus sp.]|nr:hypothetical protein [Ruminococcus sp.]
MKILKATPHNHRHTPLYAIYLHIYRHIAQIYLEIRQYSCGKFRQSDEKSDCVSGIQWLCGVAFPVSFSFFSEFFHKMNILGRYYISKVRGTPRKAAAIAFTLAEASNYPLKPGDIKRLFIYSTHPLSSPMQDPCIGL